MKNNLLPFLQQNKKNLRIALDKETFFPGETITGHVILELTQPLVLFDVMIELKRMKGCIMDLSNKKIVNECIESKLFEKRVQLDRKYQKSNQINELPPATYLFPVSFKLENDTLHSFDILINPKGYSIRYVLSAHISAPSQYPPESLTILIKSKAKALPDPLYQASCSNVRGWGFDQGTTIMTISYPKNNYRYMEDIPLKVTVDNTRGKLAVDGIKVDIIRELKLFNLSNEQVHESSKEIVQYKLPFACVKGEKRTQLHTVKFDDLEDTNAKAKYPESTKKMFLMESIDDNMIKCFYWLRVICTFSSSVNDASKPRLVLPIQLTTISEVENKPVMKENKDEMDEAIRQSQIEYEREKERQMQQMIPSNDNEDNDFFLLDQVKKIDDQCRLRDSQRREIKPIDRDNDAFLMEQIEKINNNCRMKENNSRPFMKQKDDSSSHNSFIKNDVPLFYESTIGLGSSNRKQFDFFKQSNEVDEYKEEEKQELKRPDEKVNYDQKAFEHNLGIFNQIESLGEKMKDYSIEDKKKDIIDINAL